VTLEQNKSVVQAYVRQVLTGGLDQLDEYVADCYVDHCSWRDREGLRRTIAGFRAAYPRIGFKIKGLWSLVWVAPICCSILFGKLDRECLSICT